MEYSKNKVIIIDDEPNILKTMAICLRELGLQVTTTDKPQHTFELIRNDRFDLAFVDLKMQPIDGMQVLKKINKISPQTTVIIITAHGSIDSAVAAIKQGAYHYIQKPFDFLELQLITQKALEYHKLKIEIEHLRKAINPAATSDIITKNERMLELIDLVDRIAPSNLSVLIEGESGTGKELWANLIFSKSDRSNKPFIKVNCAALPENLLESELFGHIKGAFTGAIKDRIGRFELADGGTIFLDEIAELSPSLQAKLLRILQNREFERLGDSTSRCVDIRVIAATNRNLEEAIKEGVFREDLYYRLNAVKFKLLPLRERPEDILLLIQFFLNKYSHNQKVHISPAALKLLKLNHWSGNVRELENIIQRAILISRNNMIELGDLPEEIQDPTKLPQILLSLEDVEKLHIKKVLQFSSDLNEAARILGIDPATLWRKRKRFNL